jgi:hypothetical protein
MGWPWGRGPDPHAATALETAGPLIAECQNHFAAYLSPGKLTPVGGPSVTNIGGHTLIELTAAPVSAERIDDPIYVCDFDGKSLSTSGPRH